MTREVLDRLVWCTTSKAELYKCGNLTVALERDRALFDDQFFNVSCVLASDSEECIIRIDRESAHMTSLDAGGVYSAGRFNSLVPIMQEVFEGGFTNYYAVAVVKKGTLPDVASLRDLRGKKACFSEVGSQAGWTIPIDRVIFRNTIIGKLITKTNPFYTSSFKRMAAWKLPTAIIM